MSNSFSKEERVAFEDLLEGFQDALVLSRHVNCVQHRSDNDGALQQHHLASHSPTSPSRSTAPPVTAIAGNTRA
jgi:hypothetical protein